MRILAIRGANLASLAAAFEVDFQNEPLASAGLFAIAGPTGAGKSTLLDALCLALYDDTPRLAPTGRTRNAPLPDVGEDTIAPSDSRNLLRRGAAEGYAEVDFLGHDGIAYRARWSVRRARNKASGRLQDVDMRLDRLPGLEPVAGPRKSEVKEAIVQRLGLSFDQFTRAVLLAQNEFFAFLKAGDDERATLLQTLTGTDRFETLSRLAFERQRTERTALDALEAQLAGDPPLDALARAELEQALQAARAEHTRSAARAQEAEAAAQWWQGLVQARTDEAQAEQLLATAGEALEAAAPRTCLLASIDAVQPARPLLADCLRLEREIEEVARLWPQAQQALNAADEARQKAAAEQARSEQALQAEEATQNRMQPRIAQARTLDGALGQQRQAVAAEAEAVKQAEMQHAARTTELQTLVQAIARTTQQQTSLQAWFEGHAALRPLAEDWPRWQAAFDEAAAARRSLDQRDKALTEAARAVVAAEREAARAEAGLPALQSAADTATLALEAARKAVAAFDPEQLAARRVALEGRRDHLQNGLLLFQNLKRREEGFAQGEARIRELGRQREQLDVRLKALDAELPPLRGALEQAERSLRLTEAACHAGVEQLRETLSRGQACPVCGSTDHPFAGEGGQLHELLAQQRAERDRLSAEYADKAAAAKGLAPQLQACGEDAARLERQLAEQRPALEQARQACRGWGEVAAMQLPAGEEEGALEQALAAAKQELQTQTEQELALRRAGQQVESLRAQDEAARAALRAGREALAGTQAELGRRADAQIRAAEEAARARAELHVRLAGLEQGLGAALPGGWRDTWQANLSGFCSRCAEQAADWTRRRDEQVKAEQALKEAEIRREALARACAEAAGALAQARERLAAQQRRLAAQLAEHRQLFADTPWADQTTDAVAQGLAQTLKAARDALEQAAAALRQADKARIETQAKLEGLQKRGAELQALREEAGAALDAWLQAHPGEAGQPLARSELEQLLGRDPGWLAREREALAELAAARDKAATVRDERRRQTLARQAAMPPAAAGLDQDGIARALTDATEAAAAANRETHALELRQAQDEDRRSKAAALMEKVVAQQARTRLWGRMNELMGAADGKKFRNFAQQLTLDVLLAYANRQLEALARRYRLERVADSLALQVVDRDMGDEIRSVHSLSGGESFLVSLALALGLASLSSHRVRVESLFIDEGFGSLDADTLRVAMDALDSLQAQGRKVGVISHVQEMTERIGVRVEVARGSGGASRVRVSGF